MEYLLLQNVLSLFGGGFDKEIEGGLEFYAKEKCYME